MDRARRSWGPIRHRSTACLAGHGGHNPCHRLLELATEPRSDDDSNKHRRRRVGGSDGGCAVAITRARRQFRPGKTWRPNSTVLDGDHPYHRLLGKSASVPVAVPCTKSVAGHSRRIFPYNKAERDSRWFAATTPCQTDAVNVTLGAYIFGDLVETTTWTVPSVMRSGPSSNIDQYRHVSFSDCPRRRCLVSL
jgi:hypothetical protein